MEKSLKMISKIPKKLETEYNSLEPVLRKCRDDLKRIITTQLKKVSDPRLVRVRLSEARVKKLHSLWRKAKVKNGKFKRF